MGLSAEVARLPVNREKRRANLRTAVLLGLLAAAFYASIFFMIGR